LKYMIMLLTKWKFWKLTTMQWPNEGWIWLVCFLNQFILGFLKCKYLYVCYKKRINTKDYFWHILHTSSLVKNWHTKNIKLSFVSNIKKSNSKR
jgi:hypothetical protein